MLSEKPYTGLLATIALSLFMMFLFYGKVISHLNSVYFGAGGDGLQSYTNTIYHIKYDTSYMFQRNMNYPYGENVFFYKQPVPPCQYNKIFKSNWY